MGNSRWNQVATSGTVWEKRFPNGKVGHVVPRTTWDGQRDYLAMYDGLVLGSREQLGEAFDAVDDHGAKDRRPGPGGGQKVQDAWPR